MMEPRNQNHWLVGVHHRKTFWSGQSGSGEQGKGESEQEFLHEGTIA